MNDHPIKGIDIHWYSVIDAARATAFWRDTLGLNATWTGAQGAVFLLPDGSWFGIWQDEHWTKSHGLMLAVDDVAAAVAYYSAKGVLFGALGETPSCFNATAHDSEGNEFILHHSKDGSAGNERVR